MNAGLSIFRQNHMILSNVCLKFFNLASCLCSCTLLLVSGTVLCQNKLTPADKAATAQVAKLYAGLQRTAKTGLFVWSPG